MFHRKWGHVVATFDVPVTEQGTYTLIAQPAGSDAEFKGSVRIVNSSAYSYYDPEIKAESKGQRIMVI
ncbi:MAG: hypothetical protein ACNYWM_07415 [Methanosarcinales archaeon]